MLVEAWPRVQWRWLLAIATLRLLVHLFTNGQYGFHRDELAVLDDSMTLAWGYVAYPPLVPSAAYLSMQLFGDSLAAFRAPSALAQALATLVAGLIARELGGRALAQILAALAVCCVPFSMLAGSMLQYTSPDYLWWVLAAWIVLKLANGSDQRWWLALGLVIGLGMMTRYTMLICVAGIVAGVLATPLRRQLSGPWPWIGAVAALLVFAPNALWQWQQDFIYLDFVEAIRARDVRIGRTDGFLVGQLLVGAGPLLLPLWLAGLAWLLRARAAARWRVVAWMYLVPLALFLLMRARDYYLAPAYPMLLAAGAVALEAWLAGRGAGARRAVCIAAGGVVISALALAVVIALPLFPVGSASWHASRSVHNNFAEQIGWPELTAEVARIYHRLPPDERQRTAIFASNYGQAGAINRYGPAYGLPRAISTVNSYWARGHGDPPPTTIIVLGENADGLSNLPATCLMAGRVQIPHDVENEESGHPDIHLCRDFRVPVSELWPRQPNFG